MSRSQKQPGSTTVALQRLGLGARPGDRAVVGADPRAWLRAQLAPEPELPDPIDALPSTGDDAWAFFGWLFEQGRAARRARSRGEAPPDGFQSFEATFHPRYETALEARFRAAVETDAPFRERLVHFWSGHLVISAARPVTVALPPAFERDVVRPNVMGRFEDMLLASSKHPGMLLYLDNERNLGPRSERARNPRKPRLLPIDPPTGLNENLAREILELHTLGVDGGYSQADVTRFAKVLSGWRIKVRPFFRRFYDGDDLMRFDEDSHEPGPQTVLGRVYPQEGVDQGEAVLRDLVRHPSTAHFLATKLARHFVSDDPPKALVERLARAFHASDGDLAVFHGALLDAPEVWETPLRKLRRPEELALAGARAVPEVGPSGAELHRTLREMGQLPYWAPSPAGFPDLQGEWSGGDAIWKRLAWAQDLAERAPLGSKDAVVSRAEDVLGEAFHPATRAVLASAATPAESLALLLASPEFQRR